MVRRSLRCRGFTRRHEVECCIMDGWFRPNTSRFLYDIVWHWHLYRRYFLQINCRYYVMFTSSDRSCTLVTILRTPNEVMAHAYEAQFGPVSDLIDIGHFIQSAIHLETQSPILAPVFSTSPTSVTGYEAFQQLPEEIKDSIAAECRYVSLFVYYLLIL